MATFPTFNPGKAVVKYPAIQVPVNDMFHIGPEKAILLCKPIIPAEAGFKRLLVVFNTLIILRGFRIARLINRRSIGHGLSLPDPE